MSKKELYPCTVGGCSNELPYDELTWCDDCGCPRCGEHEGCEFCETFRWSCDHCGWESDEGWEVDEPTQLMYVCGCKLFTCDTCDVKCEYPRCLYENGQLELEFEGDEDLPF